MSKKILLLHGWGGSNFPHWQSWLAGELAKEYGKVSFLQFSNFDFPDVLEWKKELRSELSIFQPDIVICHSLATTLWFHLCHESQELLTEHLYLVAPPSLYCDVDEIKDFFPIEAPSNLCATNAMLICSTNDPYMSETQANNLQKVLNIEMKMLKNAGHINTESGYGAWPWMLEEIRKKL